MPDSDAIQAPRPAAVKPQRARLSITHKLLALIGATTGAVVLFLAIYFPAQQIDASHAALQRKAATYGRLISRQVASAIAFDDRETAREVFDSVAQDSDVEALLLLTAAGTPLHGRGVPGAWVEQAKNGVAEQRVLELPGRVAVVSPVISAEGPRGTLIVEFSTRDLDEKKAAVTRTAIIVGVIALVERGHARHILLSQDMGQMPELGCRGGRGLTYLAKRFLPSLREAGLDEATLRLMTIDNPRRWLTIDRRQEVG